jgi:hypothetical protein
MNSSEEITGATANAETIYKFVGRDLFILRSSLQAWKLVSDVMLCLRCLS